MKTKNVFLSILVGTLLLFASAVVAQAETLSIAGIDWNDNVSTIKEKLINGGFTLLSREKNLRGRSESIVELLNNRVTVVGQRRTDYLDMENPIIKHFMTQEILPIFNHTDKQLLRNIEVSHFKVTKHPTLEKDLIIEEFGAVFTLDEKTRQYDIINDNENILLYAILLSSDQADNIIKALESKYGTLKKYIPVALCDEARSALITKELNENKEQNEDRDFEFLNQILNKYGQDSRQLKKALLDIVERDEQFKESVVEKYNNIPCNTFIKQYTELEGMPDANIYYIENGNELAIVLPSIQDTRSSRIWHCSVILINFDRIKSYVQFKLAQMQAQDQAKEEAAQKQIKSLF